MQLHRKLFCLFLLFCSLFLHYSFFLPICIFFNPYFRGFRIYSFLFFNHISFVASVLSFLPAFLSGLQKHPGEISDVESLSSSKLGCTCARCLFHSLTSGGNIGVGRALLARVHTQVGGRRAGFHNDGDPPFGPSLSR